MATRYKYHCQQISHTISVGITKTSPLLLRVAISLLIVQASSVLGQTPVENTYHDPLNHLELLPHQVSQPTVILFEDLACHACAEAESYITQYVVSARTPLLRYDFPLPSHVWAYRAALITRYLKAKAGNTLADDYRNYVLSSQRLIATQGDLDDMSREWLKMHHLSLPTDLDPNGQYREAINADITLGKNIGLRRTPTIIIINDVHWRQIVNAAALKDILPQFVAAPPSLK